MGTVSQKLQNIVDCKTDIANAISAKGVPCDKDGIFKEYADKIMSLEVVEPSEPKVGDIRSEGIVVYVDPANPKRFLLMSKEEFDLAWRTSADAATKIDGLTLNDGKKNCETIWGLSAYTTSPSSFPIFKAAKEYKDGTWFVPSREEIDHLFEYLLDWNRGDVMGWPTPMPNYSKEEAILTAWEAAGLPAIDLSSSTGVYWVSSQWEVNPNWWGEGVSESTFTGNGITGGDPTTLKHARFFKWVEPEAVKPKSYGGYTKDPMWPDFPKELAEDTRTEPYKAFIVVNSMYPNITCPGAVHAITSDGREYHSTTSSIFHTWDSTKDFKDSKGRNCRWIKLYFTEINQYTTLPTSCGITYYCGNMNFKTWSSQNIGSLECIEQTVPYEYPVAMPVLQCILAPNVDENGYITIKYYEYVNDYNLPVKWKWPIGLIISKTEDGLSNPRSLFKNFTNLEYLKLDYTGINMSQIPNSSVSTIVFGPQAVGGSASNMFINCRQIKTIVIEAFEANIAYSIQSATILEDFNVEEIYLPDNWPVNVRVLCRTLSVQCLVRMINALADKTGQTAGIFNVGPYNLIKLSDEEKLIATNKNWTLS